MNLAGESSENQSLKSKINQIESQIEYNLQGLFERFFFIIHFIGRITVFLKHDHEEFLYYLKLTNDLKLSRLHPP